MQRLSSDLWKSICGVYAAQATMVSFRSFAGFATFPFRAIFQGVIVSRKGGHIHLGDLALAPVAFFIKLISPSASISATVCGLDVLYENRVYQWMLTYSLPSIDRFACISSATADVLRTRGVPASSIAIIPCGVWEQEMKISKQISQSHHLITVGRLIPRKGVAWFVRSVFPLVLSEFPQATYTIVGTGKDEGLIKKIVQEMSLQHAVIMTGEVSQSRKNELLHSSDCFVMPNVKVDGDMEGFGIVCIEASSRGVPVVAARLEGLHDAVLEGKTGEFFQSGDAPDCARKISAVLSGSLASSSVAEETMRHFSWEHLATRYRNEIFLS